MTPEAARRLAEAVRRACFEAAAAAAEDAGISGLCADGRLEAALDAIRAMPLDGVLPPADADTVDPAVAPRSPRSPNSPDAPQAATDATFSPQAVINK